ncbi:MAG: hypothetical protein FWE67_09120 [Planctomycetaceae bacterium]|nr:hypothetical protein [Planctomycetaceae bacterium]
MRDLLIFRLMPSKIETGVCDDDEHTASQGEQNSESAALTEAKPQKQKKAAAKMILLILIGRKIKWQL